MCVWGAIFAILQDLTLLTFLLTFAQDLTLLTFADPVDALTLLTL